LNAAEGANAFGVLSAQRARKQNYKRRRVENDLDFKKRFGRRAESD
jgi:hypothetical protein